MKKTFQVENVKCNGCANTLKKSLLENYGEVEVDLNKFPREITLDIEDDKIDVLANQLKKLGYPLSDDTLTTIESIETKAKSFISCAIGKMS